MNNKKIGRNTLCPCGSGIKYKKCCLDKEPRIHEIALEYNVPVSPKIAQTDEQACKIRKLEAELRRVTEERDILKKATVYFAKNAE